MKPTQVHTPDQAFQAPAEQPVSGPVRIDPVLFKLVSGGASQGGHVVPDDETQAPKGGWA